MKVLVVGTGGAVVSGITVAADRMVELLEDMPGIEPVRVDAGTERRVTPNRLNVENVGAVFGDAFRILRMTRRTGAEVVWYHTFGVPVLPALRAALIALAARLGGARPVVHLHAYGLETHLVEGGKVLRSAVFVVDRLSAAIVVLYDGARDALIASTGTQKAVVLQNWADVPQKPAPWPPAPPFRLVFVGGLIVRKGIHELLDAVRLLEDLELELTLVGSAKEDGPHAQARLEESAADLVASGRVTLRGELPPAHVRHELQRAHLLVLPTRAEGLPLAMIEAMAEGRPVIVGDAGDIRRTVAEARAGVVLGETTPGAIATAVRELLADSRALPEMGERGHRYATVSRERAVKRLDCILNGAVK